MRSRFFPIFAAAFVAAVLVATCETNARAEAVVELKKGDRIAYIGNGLPDRMQHAGYLETYIHALHPNLDLVFRNLGFPGDELTKRSRSANFGTPKDWLTKCEADVVFCFFGFGESFQGDAGLEKFRSELKAQITEMKAAKYNEESAPRLVFFSPIKQEDHNSPHLSDGAKNNARLIKYTAAMREVCAAEKVGFVDLYSISEKSYEMKDELLTLNGIHLTEQGNAVIARGAILSMFGKQVSKDRDELQRLRQAVLDKNFIWYSRYRVVDGFNVYGGRSKLAWHGQSNADVMSREMQIYDVMAGNRDKRIWAVAKGGELEVYDNNLPDELPVKTNKPGKLEGGTHPYLGAEEAIGKMTVAKGMQANLFASEERFPELVNPVQMTVDPNGDLFVATWPSYPHWNPTEPMEDRICFLPDRDRDGVADDCITFADKLNSVTGMHFWGGGLVVAMPPELWFFKDTTGDGVADLRRRIFQGVTSADTHHSANSMVLGPHGNLHFSRGIFNTAQMETPSGIFRSTKSGVYRFNPRTYEIDFHFPIGPNPHGDVVDKWGYQFAGDGTGGTGSYVNIGKGIGNKQWYKKRVRPVAGTSIISSSHFPEANQGNFLICNCIGVLGVLQHEVKYNGADVTCEEIEPIVLSSDPNFRPSGVVTGGDGALYVSDWSNVLIGHMQHNMRDPNRDNQHGRIYRFTAKGREISPQVRLKGEPIASVCDAFFDPGNWVRLRARVELSGRETADVTAGLNEFAATLNPKNVTKDRDEAQALLECLWVFAEHRVPNGDLLAKVFEAEEPRVRAAAIRTLGEWGDKVDAWKRLLIAAAQDESPLVRAEALKSAVSFSGTEAAEAVFEVATREMDPELDNLMKYARKNLPIDQIVADAVKSGKTLSPAADKFALLNANVDALLKMEPRAEVYESILGRASVSDEAVTTAVDGLVKLRGVEKSDLLLKLVEERNNEEQGNKIANLAMMLRKEPSDKLQSHQRRLEKLATEGKTADVRQLGYASWISADGKLDGALVAASKGKESLRDLLEAIPAIGNEQVRANAYDSVRSLMFELPPSLSQEPGGGALQAGGIAVDYFSSNADAAIETLAKMTPAASGVVDHIGLDIPQRKKSANYSLRFTGNVIVPRNGNYTFSLSSDDGSRLYLDGKMLINNDGNHGMGAKKAKVRLKTGMYPLVVTYFNNTGDSGLDVRWSGKGIRNEKLAGDYLAISGGESLHDLAIRATQALPGHEAEKIADWSSLVQLGRSRPAAIRALRDIPVEKWNAKQVGPMVDNLVGYLTELPAKLRTGASATDATELALALSAKLPGKDAESLKNRLQNLSVRVIALGTVPHRMIYDKTKIAVAAGKEMEIRFSNTDDMPHNIAIVQPGSMEKIGKMAEDTARDPDAIARHYIPKSDDVLASGKLVQPGETDVITFTAPTKPGVYPIVCTYPGHWRRMFGALYVVEDLEEYQGNPEAYLAKNDLPIKDELLTYLDRNTEWKYDDVFASVKSISAEPRSQDSFEVGKSLFQVANCSGCHRLNNEGQNLGPDLAKLKDTPKKHTLEHIVRSIIEPSKDIEDKYRSYSFFMDDGKVHSGMIVSTADGKVTIQNDPLGKCEPIVVNKTDIEDQTQSKLSIMPMGLLNKLSEEEIIDLVAYVYAGGDKTDKMYQK